MKVIVGMFSTESNEHVPNRNTIADYDVAFGAECIRKCQVGDVFAREGIEVIPAAYVRSGPSGVIAAETFRYILSLFTEKVREHISDMMKKRSRIFWKCIFRMTDILYERHTAETML